MERITLFELNSRIKQVLKRGFSDSLWITAEITELQCNSSGHCYLQLADKKEGEETLTATARGTIWAFTFRTLRPYFETTTGRSLGKGMKVMVHVEVVFHEIYGYSLNIRDIDPTYTVGDLERKKREILMQLEKEGIIDMNRNLEFPLLPKRIAIISSATAAGLGDFMDQLKNNSYGYCFHAKLFPAVMQGEKTTDSVIAALEKVYEYESLFDVVVIIRGGGSQTDLGYFDSYDIAANIAQFPLPIITGIGHERDETIADRVAHLRMKTPTAVAAYLIEVFHEQESCLEELQHNFVTGVQEVLSDEKKRQLLVVSEFKKEVQNLLTERTTRLKLLSQEMEHNCNSYVRNREVGFDQLGLRMKSRIALLIDRQSNHINLLSGETKEKSRRVLADHCRRLELATNTSKLLDPRKVLERGYSITRVNGRAIKQVGRLCAGDLIETEIAMGWIESEVKRAKDTGENKNKDK